MWGEITEASRVVCVWGVRGDTEASRVVCGGGVTDVSGVVCGVGGLLRPQG